MISVAEAAKRIEEAVFPGPTESVSTLESAGRILRQPVVAERPFPPFDRVMMDGIGVSRFAWESGRRRFHLIGTAPAGAPRQILGNPAQAIEVMTGAIAPEGVDLVIQMEAFQREGDYANVAADFDPPPGGCIHRTGSDAAAGTALLAPGVRMDSRALAVAISCGAGELEVTVHPRIAVVSTGDELVDLGLPLEPHQIRRSNVHALKAALLERGYQGVSVHHFPDDPAPLREGLATVLAENDCVLLSGGVSKGQADFIPEALTAIGAEIVFHRVAQRPGKPMLFAKQERTVIFGLPGNPVSTLIGLYRYVLPALDLWTGATPRERTSVSLSEPISFPPPLTWFLPVTRIGIGSVAPRPVANSGDFAALIDSDGFIELPAKTTRFAAGFAAPFYPW